MIWLMMSCRSCRVSGVFSSDSTSFTASLTLASRSESDVESALNRRGPSREMMSLWTRVLRSANGSATTECRSSEALVGSADSGVSFVATWMRD